jgi:RAB6A-GEF complex partner protein 2
MPSDIQVFVRFKEPSVFAGEELECTITFKNVANEQYDASPADARSGRHSRRVSLVEQSATTPRVNSAGWSKENPRLATAALHSTRNSFGRGHRATSSLSIPKSSGTTIGSPSTPYGEKAVVRPGPNHQRSLSIISAGSADFGNDYEGQKTAQMPERSRPDLSHRRTSTLHVYPERVKGLSRESPSGRCSSAARSGNPALLLGHLDSLQPNTRALSLLCTRPERARTIFPL